MASQPVSEAPAKKRFAWLALLSFMVIMLLFFASGFSSLIYQVVWTRMLVLVFGATTFATSTVLAIFMGGLALGSFVAGKYCDRVRRPFLWYGVLEAIIGVWALLTPFMFEAATPLYKMVWQTTHASLLELSLLRFVCTTLILIVPTTCMGATLPLLARFVTNSIDSVGSRVGALYAVNTLGAVAGAMATGFFILPEFGLRETLTIGAVVNGLLLFSVLIMEQGWRLDAKRGVSVAGAAIAPAPTPEPAPPAATPRAPMPFAVKLTAFVFACSGAIAMVYEVCWTRTLLMVVGSSTYAFTLMLAAFLIGIFLGSFLCSRFIDRVKEPLFWFALLQIQIGVCTLAGMAWFNQVPYLNLLINVGVHDDVMKSMMLRFLIAGSILAPITFSLGAIFPAVVKACTTDLANVGRSVGFLYSANTFGAIIGAFLAGFVFLPMFGVEKTLIGGALINAALGWLLLWGTGKFTLKVQVACTVAGVALIAFFLRSADVWDKNIMLNAQAQRRALAFTNIVIPPYDEWKAMLSKRSEVKYYADGTCSNVGIIYHPPSKVTSLVTNGHIDASDDADMPVQALLAGFPMLLKPEAKDVGVIGWGSGQTVGVTTLFPVKSIDAIELEPYVIKASKAFHHVNLKPEEDSRVRIHYNDGRNFMLATDKKYDMILSEPSNPWQSGVCNLFTKEYFSICKSRLKEGGILAVWVQTAEVPPDNLCSILGALNSEFKYAVAFLPRPANLVVLVSDKPLTIDYQQLKKTIESDPWRKVQLAKVGITGPADMLGDIIISSAGMKSLIPSFINTDDKNRLEFDVGLSYEHKMFWKQNGEMLAAMGQEVGKQVNWGNTPKSEQGEVMAKAARVAGSHSPPTAKQWAVQSVAASPTALGLQFLGALSAEEQDMLAAERYFARALELSPKDNNLLTWHGSLLCSLGNREKGRTELQQAINYSGGKDKLAAFFLAGTYSGQLLGPSSPEDKAGIATAKEVIKLLGGLPDDADFCKIKPNVRLLAAQAYYKLGESDRAEKYVLEYMKSANSAERRQAQAILDMIMQSRS